MDTKKLRQKILNLAIHGKLVPQDPNDEPASVLLERIRAEKERLIKEGKIKKSKASKTSDTPHYEQMPFEVPSSWEWTTLGAISNYGENKNVQIENIEAEEWILELEDIEKDSAKIIQYLSKNERKINGTRHKFCKGEILYSKLRTYLNKVLIAPNNGYCTTEIMPFVTFGLSNEYVCHVLRSPYFLDYTQQCGYGVKMPRLSTTDACNGMIPLPPLAEQYRIISEIEKWFAFIDIIESGKTDLQTTIKQTKCKILDLAIHGKLVPQDPSDEPASELLKRINPKAELTSDNGQYGKMPKRWGGYKLGDVASYITDFVANGSFASLREHVRYYDGKEYAIIVRTKDFQNNFTKDLIYTDKHGYDFLSKSKLFGGELMLPNIGASIGKVFIIPKLNHPMTLGPNSVIISFKDDITKSWAYYLFLSPYGQELLLAISSSTAQGKFNKTDLRNTLFPLPSLGEQHRIVAKIEELFSSLENIQKALEV